MVSQACTFVRLGRLGYRQGLELQGAIAQARKEAAANEDGTNRGGMADVLLLTEHPHVFTLGRRGKQQDILASPAALAALGADVCETDRGGEATYHGPGQLVGYPIMNIRHLGGPKRYVWGLEQTILATLSDYGVQGRRIPGLTGVWVGDKKIAAIGVRISRDVTTHGFALNVTTDLSYFEHIIPCGDPEGAATSLATVIGKPIPLDEVALAVAENFGKVFNRRMVEIAPDTLAEEILARAAGAG